jgi:hypothetical protein
LSASDTDEAAGADSDEVDDDELEQAATNPNEATTMNSPDSLFI